MKLEGAMRTRRVAPGLRVWRLLAATIALSSVCAAQATQEEEEEEENTSTTTQFITVTTSVTQTFTVTQGDIASSSNSNNNSSIAVPLTTAGATDEDEMTSSGSEYRLQGCFGAQDGVDSVLGSTYATVAGHEESGGTGMTLTACLILCASAGNGKAEEHIYPYVGVMGGDSCYCGQSLNSAAPEVNSIHCVLPCTGNASEACGGSGYISVYKLFQMSNSSQPSSKPKFDTGDTSSSIDTNNSAETNRSRPAVTTGIAVGTVAGFALLVFLIFFGYQWHNKRRRAQALLAPAVPRQKHRVRNRATSSTSIPSSSDPTRPSTQTTSSRDTMATVYEKRATIRDAMRVDMRRLDGVVMDKPWAARGPVATASGAEWRNSSNNNSPLTPRTPRYADVGASHLQPPSILVFPPDHIAPAHGLGERAWHRRRLSVPFPPDGVGVIVGEEEGAWTQEPLRDDRRGLPSPVSAGTVVGDLSSGYEGAETVSALEDDGGSSSWRWTVSTVSGAERQV